MTDDTSETDDGSDPTGEYEEQYPQPAGYDPDDIYTFEPPPETWAFRAMPHPWSPHAQGVYDGDTYDVLINLEFGTYHDDQIRAVHIDTAEISGRKKYSEEWKAGVEQRDFARDWMRRARERADDEWCLVLRTRGDRGDYDRLLAEVFDTEGNSLERDLIDEFEDDQYFRWGDLY